MANTKECEKAGVDPKDVDRIARRIERACHDANKLGIRVFMGAACYLMADDGCDRKLVLEIMHIPNADGGDGAVNKDEHGLWRGE